MLGVGMAVLAGVAALVAQPWWRERRRARWRAQPFSAAWREIVRQRVPAVARLPEALQRRLEHHIQVFVAEKPFVGCHGQPISDEIRVTIAAQACLLLLGHARPEYYPRLRQVLVYPDVFVVRRERPLGGGVVNEQWQAMAGESWSQGQVILAWAEVLAGAADPDDGHNVVLHEFAHQIDQDTGVADGRPWRPSPALRRRWASVMDHAFAHMHSEPQTWIDAQGATNPAEFFAMVTELFFETPRALAEEVPAVYRELVELYRLHPLTWSAPRLPA
jgi:Mlc titration factor MtfA (ptsG expression regulator)